jgi:DNA/RNA-binding domain of Phe-tRNA-synthetase-like protein
MMDFYFISYNYCSKKVNDTGCELFNRKKELIIYSSITMEKIILQLIQTKPQDRNLDLLTELKRDFAKKNNLPDLPSNIQLLQQYYTLLKAKKITKDPQIEQLLKKRAVRSSS